MATAGLAIVLSATVIAAEFRGKPSTVRRKLLNGFSDSQILQGIGIQSRCLSNRAYMDILADETKASG